MTKFIKKYVRLLQRYYYESTNFKTVLGDISCRSKFEFRSWKTNYRGKILIHARTGIDKDDINKYDNMNLKYPSRRIIAISEIEDCLEFNEQLNKKIIAKKQYSIWA